MEINALIIEDNPADAALIREMLAGCADICLAHEETLCSGLERLSKGGLDIVLLDLTLPDSYGFDTFAQVIENAPKIPIILLTGLEDESLGTVAVKSGAQDYLVKGQIEERLLARSIRHAIERKKLLLELEKALLEIKVLKGLIPICAWCKKIRDDRGYWNQLEEYFKRHIGAEFTHGICPQCAAKLKAELGKH